ncbi:MAG: hypothetical protein ACLP2J_12050 [Acidimicrobiales bacterium]
MTMAIYYVYENWTNTFAKVHRGSCPYCNDGRGIQGRGSKTPSGQWLGPFHSADEAMAAASAAASQHSNGDVWVVASCGYCG